MLISKFKKFIMVDIPKTASSAFRKSIEPTGILSHVGQPNEGLAFYQHATIQRIALDLENEGVDYSDFSNFAVIRNPWERYFSFYTYYKEYVEKYKNKDTSIYWDTHSIQQAESLKVLFDKNDIEKIMWPILKNNKTQFQFVADKYGDIIVDNLLKFENLETEFQKVADFIGYPTLKLPVSNKSKNYDFTYRDIFPQNIIDHIGFLDKELIEVMGYNG